MEQLPSSYLCRQRESEGEREAGDCWELRPPPLNSKESDRGGGGGASRGGGQRAPPSVPNRTGQFLLIIEPSTDNKI